MKKLLGSTAGIASLLLIIVGGYYLFFPHATHMKYHVDFGLSHSIHLTFGAFALLIGVIILAISIFTFNKT